MGHIGLEPLEPRISVLSTEDCEKQTIREDLENCCSGCEFSADLMVPGGGCIARRKDYSIYNGVRVFNKRFGGELLF